MVEHTNYRFVPVVRRGYRPSKPFTKSDLGDFKLNSQGKTSIEYTAEVTKGPDAGTGEGTATETVDLSMYGPAHVTGIDSGQVVRMEPEPDSSTTPPNYFPFVEFETPDLPWLFSPVSADRQGRSFPWLMLVAIPKSKVSVAAAGGRPNPVLKVKQKHLAPVEDAWAWAHAQVTGQPVDDPTAAFTSRSNATVSRLICPRNLDPSTSYVAAVVPTFEAGRKVGLGEEPPSQGDANNPKLALAWGGSGSSGELRLPAYHHWEFATSKKGDFEYLVRQLEPEDLTNDEYDIGYREVDVTNPGPETLDYDDGTTHNVKLGGALQAAECDDRWWYDRSDELRTLLNQPAAALGVDTGTYPVVGPPVYGRWHSQEIFERGSATGEFRDLSTGTGFDWSGVSTAGMTWCDSDGGGSVPSSVRAYDGYGPLKPKLGASHYDERALQWLYDLNLTPSFRIPASVGAGIVQDQQENLMKSAWDQVGDVREANRRLAAAQLSAGAMRPAVERLAAGSYPTERLLQVTEPAHERMYVDAKGTTAASHLENSRLREGVLSPAFRRLTSPAGRLSERIAGDASGMGIVSGMLDGSLDTGIAAGPDGMVSADTPDLRFDELCRNARSLGEQEGERVSWREPTPEQRDRRRSRRDTQGGDQGGSQSTGTRTRHPGSHGGPFQPPADVAHDRLWTMRGETEVIRGKLERIEEVVSGYEPTQSTVTTVRREANDAVGAWHSLDPKVGNFQGLVARVSNQRGSLPNVADSFDATTSKNLYDDMAQPFTEPFLPSVSDRFVWPEGLRTFSGAALEEALELTRLPSLSSEAPTTIDVTEDLTSTPGSGGAPGGGGQGNDGTGDDSDTSTDGGDPSTDGGRRQSGQQGGGGQSGPSYPVTLAEVRAAEQRVEAVQGAIDDILGYFGEGGSDAASLVRLFCQRSYTESDPAPAPDATAVAESWTPLESFVDRTLDRLGAPGLRRRADPLDTIMAYPEFDQPMYRDLKEVSEKYILPGAKDVPSDSVGALRTNRRFIEAFLVGLNHEMGSELLWRNYPTDRRGSYFKRFWNQQSRIPKPTDEAKLDDVIPLHRWDDKGKNNRGPSPLGSNVRTGETDGQKPPDERTPGGSGPDPDAISPTVVLLIRGELLRRYPNTTIYAAKAHDKQGNREPKWASSKTKAANTDTDYVKFPIFRGRLDPDINFFGFDLTTDEATGATETVTVGDKSKTDDLGWFFVLSEPPGETKFGLDIGQQGETKPPFGIAKGHGSAPVREATEKEVQQGVEAGWSGLSWKHLKQGGGDPSHIKVDDHRPAGSNPWTVEKGTVWAKSEAWTKESKETDQTAKDTPEKNTQQDFTFTGDQAATWGRNAAHMAFITWQKPVRVAIHADDILPGGGA